MNDARRKQIEAIKARMTTLLEEAALLLSDVEVIRDEEQDYRDAMPDSLAEGERGQKADTAIEALDEVVEGLQALIEIDFDEKFSVAAK